MRLITAESRLRSPRRFLADFVQDLRTSGDAARQLFRQSIAATYRHSSLGMLWAVAPSMVAVLAVVAGQRWQLVGSDGDAASPALFAVFGVLMAHPVLEAITSGSALFRNHRDIVARNTMVLEALMVAVTMELLFNTMIRVLVAVIALMMTGATLTAATLLIVPGFLGLALAGVGVGLLLAPLTRLNKDLGRLLMLLPWILFAVTPVFFRSTPGSGLAAVQAANPMTWLFDSLRHVAYGAPGTAAAAALSLPVGLGLCLAGLLWCRVARPYVIEHSTD